MIRRAATLAIVTGAAAAACNPAGRDATPHVTVFAAASTAPFITAFARAYEEQTGVRVRCSFAASSTLARQIEEGAPADVFVSAHPQWMDHLQAADLIVSARRSDLLANRLVLAVRRDAAPATIVDLAPGASADRLDAWPGRIAVGDPDHVPVGIYARQALRAIGWWDALEPRLLPANDARAVLRLVEIGEADTAVVYLSDALASSEVAIAARFAPGTHDAILYPVALHKGASAAASDFLIALTAPDTRALRTSFGFTIPP